MRESPGKNSSAAYLGVPGGSLNGDHYNATEIAFTLRFRGPRRRSLKLDKPTETDDKAEDTKIHLKKDLGTQPT